MRRIVLHLLNCNFTVFFLIHCIRPVADWATVVGIDLYLLSGQMMENKEKLNLRGSYVLPHEPGRL